MMRRATLVLVTMVALGAPAVADYVRLGSVDVGYRTDADTAYSQFGGRMEGLRLTASRSDIFCRAVIVRFENGETQNVFSGRLDERQPIEVDLRGRARRVDSVRFVCRSDEFRGGRIFVEGEVGRYRDEWRRDRDWDRRWAGLFGMGPGRDDWRDGRRNDWRDGRPDRDDWRDRDRMGPPPDRRGPDGWIFLGRQIFEGGDDKGMTGAGWAGRHVDRLALRPLEGDVRCNRVDANFDNGQNARLDKNRVIQQGQMNVYEVPGRDRNLASLYMRCHAIGNYRVTIEIYAQR